jgi:hypothetical protein
VVKESFPYESGIDTRIIHKVLGKGSPIVCRNIHTFTTRELSYPTDSLRAMMGVFRHLERSGSIFCHYWGIPILPCSPYADESLRTSKSSDSALASFVHGLCWRRSTIMAGWYLHRPVVPRRLGFPSWSWCWWDNTPDGVSSECNWDKCYFIRSLTIIYGGTLTDGELSGP